MKENLMLFTTIMFMISALIMLYEGVKESQRQTMLFRELVSTWTIPVE